MRMREIIDLVEAADPCMIGGARNVVLKDGTRAKIILGYVDINGNPDTSGENSRVCVEATINSELAGTVYFSRNHNVPDWDEGAVDSWSSSDTHVNMDYRRIGVARAMYNAFTKAGFKIIRSGEYGGKLTPDGHALWRSQKPYSRNWKARRKTVK